MLHIYRRRYPANSAFSDEFQILEFLLLAAVARGEKYTHEVLKELAQLGVPLMLPRENVIYMRLKDLVRDQLLSSRQQARPRRIYFSITQEGRRRMNDLCTMAHCLDTLAHMIDAREQSNTTGQFNPVGRLLNQGSNRDLAFA
jgi:DNA-binding PadR family transcriptional regulator